MDKQGRVAIPASFRRVLEACDPDCPEGGQPAIYLLYGDHRKSWILAYSAAAMAQVDAQIDAMPRGSVERQRAEDYFYANTVDATLDDAGRLTLPAAQRAQVNIGGEVLFKAAGDTFKIMAPEADAPAQARLRDWLDGEDEMFDPASLLPNLPPAV